MPGPTNFSAYYKTISDTELLTILDKPEDYLPEAIEAATNELASRQLTDEEKIIAKAPLEYAQLKQKKQAEKIKAIESTVKSSAGSFLGFLNPVSLNMNEPRHVIGFITIMFSFFFLNNFFSEYSLHVAYIKDFNRFPEESTVYLLPHILWLMAIITFGLRKKVGWILLVIFLSFLTMSTFWMFMSDFNRGRSQYSVFNEMFEHVSVTTFLITMLFIAGNLYVLCKKKIRDVYSVSSHTAKVAIGFTMLLTFFYLLSAVR